VGETPPPFPFEKSAEFRGEQGAIAGSKALIEQFKAPLTLI
jgi:hypothetical protein